MSTDINDLQSEVQDLKAAMAVQEATQAGQAATNAAAHAGTWSTFVVGGVALSVGMLLGLALVRARAS